MVFNFLTLWPLFMDGVQLPQGCSHFEEAVYFLPLSYQKFPVLILSASKDERLAGNKAKCLSSVNNITKTIHHHHHHHHRHHVIHDSNTTVIANLIFLANIPTLDLIIQHPVKNITSMCLLHWSISLIEGKLPRKCIKSMEVHANKALKIKSAYHCAYRQINNIKILLLK